MISRGREWTLRALLVAGSLAVASLLLLAGLEAWLASKDLPRDTGTLLRPHPASPRLIRLAPDTTARFTGVPVRSNRFGYRGAQWSVEKPPGAFRIAVLGDSQTFGYGVPEEETYPARLERRLREAFPDRAWEVLNLAMIGFNTAQEAETCSLDVRGLAPDLVLLGFFINDVDPPVRPKDIAPPAADEALARRRAASLAYRIRSLRSYVFLRSRLAAVARAAGMARVTATGRYREAFLSRSEAWRSCEAGIRALRDEVRARGGRFAVVILPTIVTLDDAYPLREAHAQIAAFCEGEGVPCLDLLPAFLGKSALALSVSPINNHMNGEGNRIAAEALFGWLAASGLLSKGRAP